PPGGVVTPAPARPVPRRGEPALVATQDLARQRRAADPRRGRPVIGPQGSDHVVPLRFGVLGPDGRDAGQEQGKSNGGSKGHGGFTGYGFRATATTRRLA